MPEWYAEDDTPDRGVWWWAVEHRGHPAFYARALMLGDFAPGRAVAPRHVLQLDGAGVTDDEAVACGTCGEAPAACDLEPIERATGQRGFLEACRSRRAPWPKATDPATCWECGAPAREVTEVAEVPAVGVVNVCARCAALYPEG